MLGGQASDSPHTGPPRDPMQPERDENGEGRKRAEKGQKMAERTKRVRILSFAINGLGWLGNLDSNQD